MADTTVSIPVDRRDGGIILVPIAAGVKILQGIIVCANAAGYAVQGSDTANLRTLGLAAEEVDNTGGAAGDLSVRVERGQAYKLLNDPTNPVTIANVGTAGAAVIKDNQTVCVAAGATNDIPVGKPVQVDADGVWVEIL
ncbi:MAG TPA: hypothetical protein VGE39_00695 [Prosthecobacter sp.]